MYFLTENWDTWYPGGADSESGLRHLKFRSPDLFLGGEGGGRGVNLCYKSQNCSFCLQIGTRVILEALIPNPELYF